MADPQLIDSYRRLELPVGAPLEDIKAAYRGLARQYHPDVQTSQQATAAAQFIAIHVLFLYD